MRILKLLPVFMLVFCPLQALWANETLLPVSGIDTPEQDPGQEYFASQRGWQLTQSTRYRYNEGWRPYTLEQHGYNAQGQLDLLTRHRSVDGVWELSGARDYVYNADGLLHETVYYTIVDGQWSGWGKETCLYDSDGNLGQLFYLVGGNQGWMLATMQVNGYGMGLLVSEHVYSYYDYDGTFSDSESRIFSYNAAGQLVEKTILTFVDGQGHTLHLRYLYSYNPDGKLAEILYQFWNWIGGEYVWRDDRRDIHSYETDGHLTEVLQQYNSDSQGWHDTRRYLYTNDAYGSAVHTLYQINSAEGWQDRYKWINVYANTDSQEEQITAAGLSLSSAPNPFSTSTQISFQTKESTFIELAVYNLKGQKVRTLASSDFSAGRHSLAWDKKDDRGKDLAAGIYLIRLRLPTGESAVRKVTIHTP